MLDIGSAGASAGDRGKSSVVCTYRDSDVINFDLSTAAAMTFEIKEKLFKLLNIFVECSYGSLDLQVLQKISCSFVSVM